MLSGKDRQLLVNNGDKVMAYKKGTALFVYNLDPSRSYEGYRISVPEEGEYRVILSTDDFRFGGQGRVHHLTYRAEKQPDGCLGFQLYLPSRTAVVLKKLPAKKK